MGTGRMEAIILLFSVATSGAAAGLGTRDAPGAVGPDQTSQEASERHASEPCDLSNDAGHAVTWFADIDGDGWGDWDVQVKTCSPTDATIPVAGRGGDCDDTNALVGPHAVELPGNGIDENCDGADGPARMRPRRSR